MTALDVVSSHPSAVSSPTHAIPRRFADFVAVSGAWGVAVAATAVLPKNAAVADVALFVHVVSMAVGFGSVVMIDVYGLMWLFGRRTLADLTSLSMAAHGVIAVGVGGLLASGIALKPDITSPLARLKLGLVLVLMLNSVAAQRYLHRMRQELPPGTRGDGIPWTEFRRGLAVALISQAAWWGAITIGFLTNASRNG